jgi:branched-chain amino acid transport system permease protein
MRMLPSGTFHESYRRDHALWQWRTGFTRLALAAAVALVVLLPFYASGYILGVANVLGYTVLSALGVQLLIGYCGQVTLGHAAFIAVGAYGTGIGILQYGLPYPIALAVGALLAGLWSVLFGLPSARTKGFYLIMTTMAAQFVTVDLVIAQYVSQIGGRGVAFSLPPGTIRMGTLVVDTEHETYYLMLILVILCTTAVINLLRTRIGRAWVAIRDNDVAAEALGVNIFTYKLLAFFVAGILGGIAGGFWVSANYGLTPEDYTLAWSLWLVGVILIGGVGSVHGVFFGAAFLTGILEVLKALVFALADAYPMLNDRFLFIKEMAFGLSIIGFLLYEPRGLAYRWQQIKTYFKLWPFGY